MLVEKLLLAAHKKLVTIVDDSPLIQAAKLLRAGTDLVVVCGSAGFCLASSQRRISLDKSATVREQHASPPPHW
jgi:hypothetical protein